MAIDDVIINNTREGSRAAGDQAGGEGEREVVCVAIVIYTVRMVLLDANVQVC